MDFCYRELPDAPDPFDRDAIRDDPMEFYIGATDVNTGKCVYHKCTDGGEKDFSYTAEGLSKAQIQSHGFYESFPSEVSRSGKGSVRQA